MCCRGQGLLVRKTGRVWLAAAVLAFAVLEAIPRAIAGDGTNVPLKKWGGFSEFRDAVYDALARLATGYAKFTLYNVELLVGRDSLAWGPGYHNALLLSNNAAPLDQIRVGAAEPFLLPWIGKWVGPTKVLFFLAQLEERRDHPF